LLVLRIPLAVILGIYTLWVINHVSTGSLAATFFSASYVQLVQQVWVYQPPWFNNKNILSTAIVRVIAVSTAILAAFVINTMMSVLFMRRSFDSRLKKIDRLVRNDINTIDLNHTAHDINKMFAFLIGFRDDVDIAVHELGFRKRIGFGSESDLNRLEELNRKAQAIFDMLAAQVFLSLAFNFSSMPVQHRSVCHILLQASKRHSRMQKFRDRSLFAVVRDKIETEGQERFDLLLLNIMTQLADRLEQQDHAVGFSDLTSSSSSPSPSVGIEITSGEYDERLPLFAEK